jgi:hypothetical protein
VPKLYIGRSSDAMHRFITIILLGNQGLHVGTYPGSKDMRMVVFILVKSGEDVDLCSSYIRDTKVS